MSDSARAIVIEASRWLRDREKLERQLDDERSPYSRETLETSLNACQPVFEISRQILDAVEDDPDSVLALGQQLRERVRAVDETAATWERLASELQERTAQLLPPEPPEGYVRFDVPVDARSVRRAAAFVELWHRGKRLEPMLDAAAADVAGLSCGLLGLTDLIVSTFQEELEEPADLIPVLAAFADGINDPDRSHLIALGMIANRMELKVPRRWSNGEDEVVQLRPEMLGHIEVHLAVILDALILATADLKGEEVETFFAQIIEDLRSGERFESSLAVLRGDAFYRKRLRVSSDPDLGGEVWAPPCSQPGCDGRAVDAHEVCRNHLARILRQEGIAVPTRNDALWAAVIHLTRVALAKIPEDVLTSDGHRTSILAFAVVDARVDRRLPSMVMDAFATHLSDLFGAMRVNAPSDFHGDTMVSCRLVAPDKSPDLLASAVAEAVASIMMEMLGDDALLKYGAWPKDEGGSTTRSGGISDDRSDPQQSGSSSRSMEVARLDRDIGRVLIADRTGPIRLGLERVLEASGFDIVGFAANGAEAVRLAGELRPDVVTMAINMPVMDGLRATALIRERFPEVQVAILTAYPDETFRREAQEAGAAAYLVKNECQPSDLPGILQSVVRLARNESPP